MNTLLVLNTTKRPGDVDYFTDTLARVEAAGASAIAKENKLIYSDGPFGRETPAGWELIETPEATGTLPGLEAISKIARERNMDLLFLEDDITLTKNAITKMMGFEVPDDLGFVSFFDFYTAAGHANGIEKRGYEDQVPLQAGVQAIKFPRRSLDFLWGEGQPQSVLQGKKFGRLYVIKFYFWRHSPWKQFGMHFPHLVQHIGEVSAVNGTRSQMMAAAGEKRISNNFPGEDFDALST